MHALLALTALVATLWSGGVMADEAQAACLRKGTALVAALSAGDAATATADFDATMRAALPPDALAAAWAATLARYGDYAGAEPATAASGNAAAPQLAVIPLRFRGGLLNAVVACDRDGAVAGFHLVPRMTPPAPAAASEPPPSTQAYTTEALTVGAAGIRLGATLYQPRAAAPGLPAVLLLAGSGPQDRDSTLGASKPLRDLAVGLAARGIVALSYDKRAYVYPGLAIASVEDEVVDDAVDVLQRLAAQPGVDPRRVYLLGHSWGGTLAPRVAARSGNVAGLVLLAPSTEPLDRAYRRQLDYLAQRDREIDAVERALLDQADAELVQLDALRRGAAPQGRLPLGIPASYWQGLEGYDPVAEASRLRVPVFALWAGRDYQVIAASAQARWRRGFADASLLTTRIEPELGHTFMAMSDPPAPERLLEAGQVAPTVVAAIAAWITRDGADPVGQAVFPIAAREP